MGVIRDLIKRLILWALGDEYPKIIIVQKTETVSEIRQIESPIPSMIDIRVPKKAKR
jgi:hypothetical protein